MLEIVDKKDVKYEGGRIYESLEFDLKCSKYHPHEYYGVKYLLSVGYKQHEISINGKDQAGYPDITTFRIIDSANNDWKLWEVKIVRNNTIIFGLDQILHMPRDTNILIFRKDQEEIEPIDTVKFEDIISGKYNKYEVSVVAHIDLQAAIFLGECLSTKNKKGDVKCQYE